jgi:NAD(P)-dependent dehydrogenase (short-subunit alcohol dehydrogenase family)
MNRSKHAGAAIETSTIRGNVGRRFIAIPFENRGGRERLTSRSDALTPPMTSLPIGWGQARWDEQVEAIEGKIAVVTGAGSGLGRHVAIQLAGRGCSVAVVDIQARGAEETAATCRAASGQALAIAQDLTTSGAADALVGRVTDELGRLDILVNNAGYGAIEPFLDMTEALWDRTLAINVKALAMLSAAAGRVMRDQLSGRIVNITSPASRMALPNYTAYAASKAAVDAITRAAAVALAPYGVLVNSLAPGMMDTEMQRSTEADLARLAGRTDMQAFLAERTARVPLGRRVGCDEVAAGVVWLALDAPDYITAERLNFSGGLDKD